MYCRGESWQCLLHLVRFQAAMSSPTTKHFDAKSVAASTTNTRKTTGSTRSVQGRLNAMADDFNTFYGDLEEETTIRKKAEEDRVARMEREVSKIEKVLATETKRRIEASKALQTMFETKITALQQDFKEELRTVFEPLQGQIDALVGRVETIEKTMQVCAAGEWVYATLLHAADLVATAYADV